MVISGKGSTLDFYTALEIIAAKLRDEAIASKNKMGTTHEIPKNTEGSPPNISLPTEGNSEHIRRGIPEVVPERD